jgi:hypothetical protein
VESVLIDTVLLSKVEALRAGISSNFRLCTAKQCQQCHQSLTYVRACHLRESRILDRRFGKWTCIVDINILSVPARLKRCERLNMTSFASDWHALSLFQSRNMLFSSRAVSINYNKRILFFFSQRD